MLVRLMKQNENEIVYSMTKPNDTFVINHPMAQKFNFNGDGHQHGQTDRQGHGDK